MGYGPRSYRVAGACINASRSVTSWSLRSRIGWRAAGARSPDRESHCNEYASVYASAVLTSITSHYSRCEWRRAGGAQGMYNKQQVSRATIADASGGAQVRMIHSEYSGGCLPGDAPPCLRVVVGRRTARPV
eukprot:scaffold63149_cov53-Phaeocystis_antarctica.AAC.5